MNTTGTQVRRAGSTTPPTAQEFHGKVNSTYDSEDFPVLIRLPDLAAPAPTPSKKPPAASRSAPPPEKPKREERQTKPKASRPPIALPTASAKSKYVWGGVVAGTVIAALLFLRNGGVPQKPEPTGWDLPASELVIQDPAIELPDHQPTERYPEFIYEMPTNSQVKPAANEIPSTPDLSENRRLELANSKGPEAASPWPLASDSTPLRPGASAARGKPVSGWPQELEMRDTSQLVNDSAGSSPWPPSRSGASSQADANASVPEAFRTGRLTPRESRPNTLNGTIEIPTPTSIR